jgi:hypothetical protein
VLFVLEDHSSNPSAGGKKGTNELFSNHVLRSFIRLWPSMTSIFHGLSCTFEDLIILYQATEEEWTAKGRNAPSTLFMNTDKKHTTSQTSQITCTTVFNANKDLRVKKR